MDFPSRVPIVSKLPEIIKKSLNIQPKEVYKLIDYLLVYETEKEVKNIKIDKQIVTAKGNNCDFISRFFTPQASVLEDYVTGSAHCSLIPFWSLKLGEKELNALQISPRIGKLQCKNKKGRVISGKAKTYSIGNLWTE